MLSEATILSRCKPRRSSTLGSSTLGSSASSTGVDGGCKAAEPDGSITAGISGAGLPLVNSGDSTAGVSAGAFTAGFTLGFLVETLGIDTIKLVGSTGFQLPDAQSITHWTPCDRNSSNWDDHQPERIETFVSSIRQGKFRSQLTHTLTHLDHHVKPANQIFLVRFPLGRVL